VGELEEGLEQVEEEDQLEFPQAGLQRRGPDGPLTVEEVLEGGDKMPVPKPGSGESQKDFMGRCMGFLKTEGTTGDQAVAICRFGIHQS